MVERDLAKVEATGSNPVNRSIFKILMKIFLIFLLPLLSFFLHSETCKHSKWGEGDELGNANLLTEELVLKASDLIKTGKVYSLGLVIDQDTPALSLIHI